MATNMWQGIIPVAHVKMKKRACRQYRCHEQSASESGSVSHQHHLGRGKHFGLFRKRQRLQIDRPAHSSDSRKRVSLVPAKKVCFCQFLKENVSVGIVLRTTVQGDVNLHRQSFITIMILRWHASG